MSQYPVFAELLNQYLVQADRSNSWLARRLEVHPSTVTNWLNGQNRPRDPETVIRIADVLGIHDDERQQLLLAAGYGYYAGELDEPLRAEITQNPPESPATSTTEPDPTPSPNTEPDRADAAWYRTNRPPEEPSPSAHVWSVQAIPWFWLGLATLILLFSLAHVLTAPWPIGQFTVMLMGLLVGGSMLAVKHQDRFRQRLLSPLFNHPRWFQTGIAFGLLLAIWLWGQIGIPSLYGTWRIPSRHERGDAFGQALTSGDFDGDGYADLAIGAPGETASLSWLTARSGWVYTRRGTSTWPPPAVNFGQAGLGLNEADDRFGWALAAGDFDGDGNDDLAVGAPGERLGLRTKSGYVFAFQGHPNGLRPWYSLGQDGISFDEPDDRFGWALATGDFNGDGRDDLAVGAPGEHIGGALWRTGLVFVYRGTTQQLQPWHGLRSEPPQPLEDAQRFGWALAAGDFDGDGNDDLAVATPGAVPQGEPQELYAGQVLIFRSNAERLDFWHALDQRGLDRNEAGDRFGWALAAADFNGDGMDDLAIGAPYETVDKGSNSPMAGAVYVFRGTVEGLTAWQHVDQSALDTPEEDDRFGWALAAADFDTDGYADLVIGAPGERIDTDEQNPQSGAVFLYKGHDKELGPWHTLDQELLGRNETGDRFGEALATGDFDGDGKADLAVGAPGEKPGSDPQSGYVFTFRATTDGLAAWHGAHQEQ